ncbi:LOW QUALITY PROTEIN: nucleoside diphosphate-linked moiety X motif 17 [Rhynochetos jubatus]
MAVVAMVVVAITAVAMVAVAMSVTGAFCPAQGAGAVVSCGLDRGAFLPRLQHRPCPGTPPPTPQRPSFCPAKRLGGRRPPPSCRAGEGGGRVLLTRRAGTLRAFPNGWVPPGGHAEPGEEVKGRCRGGGCAWTPGPSPGGRSASGSRGLPQRHHAVAFLLPRSAEPHGRLERERGERLRLAAPPPPPPALEATVG